MHSGGMLSVYLLAEEAPDVCDDDHWPGPMGPPAIGGGHALTTVDETVSNRTRQPHHEKVTANYSS